MAWRTRLSSTDSPLPRMLSISLLGICHWILSNAARVTRGLSAGLSAGPPTAHGRAAGPRATAMVGGMGAPGCQGKSGKVFRSGEPWPLVPCQRRTPDHKLALSPNALEEPRTASLRFHSASAIRVFLAERHR